MRAGGAFEFRLLSNDFDAFNIVGGAEGNGAHNDDDPEGRNTDSRLVLTGGNAGGYLYVTATSFWGR